MDPTIAVDAAFDKRPGVPRVRTPPEPIASQPLPTPPEGVPEILVEPTRQGLPAVFGTRHAPRGLSGVLRRAAYRQPDYHVRRWLMLLVADRVDAQEARLERALRRPVTWCVLGAGLLALALRRGRRHR